MQRRRSRARYIATDEPSDWVANSFPFRITLNLNKEGYGPLLWNRHAPTQAIDGATWTDVWTARSEDAPVPLGEWFTLEVELREGCEEEGTLPSGDCDSLAEAEKAEAPIFGSLGGGQTVGRPPNSLCGELRYRR